MVGNTPPNPDAAEEKDIWHDVEVLHFRKTHNYERGMSARNKGRVYHRAKAYRWMADSIFKVLIGGTMVVVPRPEDKASITLETHRGMGHKDGVQRVLDRLQKKNWWRGMGDTVVDTIKVCLSCARVKAGFRESRKELQPLPVRGLGYRWGVDFAGPLTKTSAGNTWVLGIYTLI